MTHRAKMFPIMAIEHAGCRASGRHYRLLLTGKVGSDWDQLSAKSAIKYSTRARRISKDNNIFVLKVESKTSALVARSSSAKEGKQRPGDSSCINALYLRLRGLAWYILLQ
ncbi:uncharacterized protein MCYG_03326 [Microsporum canis CBS 113480]|uniref:Uncharacterized protein n=1 Tax=Arthroderma otae (strain ATCC MYA-4605 / CBS 113480) TaxID=554155 RepID=C5FLD5_ARTOC|nr:uncharacterized protein MCYG_03326 [Microsporum canis CBS 113480]EEQ30507.1 predicted protein [Microsporum canis CBS 113480]